jgi:hypothetical protein
MSRLAAALLFLALPAAAQTDVEKKAAAEKAALSWLQGVDAGRYAESWDAAAALFKKAVTRSQWTQALGSVRPPLGSLLSRKLKSATHATTLPGVPDGEYVVLEFEASFEKKRSAVETVTPTLDSDGVWRVSGYYIR